MTTKRTWFVILTNPVAGVHHHVSEETFHKIKPYDRLVLVREPKNEWDKFAVRLDLLDGTKIGYVPKTYSRTISQLLDHGYRIGARVYEVTPNNGMVLFELLMEDRTDG